MGNLFQSKNENEYKNIINYNKLEDLINKNGEYIIL